MSRLTLSTLQVDQEQLATQFTDDLSKNPVWVDILTAGIGQSMVNWFSAIGAYEQYAIQRAVEESFLSTAQQDASILLGARMLGVHILRKVPGSVPCTLTSNNTVTYTVPAYSNFLMNGVNLFNRTALVFNPGVATVVTLYEGQVINEDFISPGGPFQRFYIGSAYANYISDLDIIANTPTSVIGGSSLFSSTIKGLWDVGAGQPIFYENTLYDGTIEVLFGNDVYGAAPLAGNIITFTYVKTNGLSGNSLNTGIAVTQVGSSYLSGTNTGPIADGQDARPPSFYKDFAPFIFSARDRAVTQDDFRALALTYTAQNITDIVFLGQKDTHPTDVTWMNMVQYSLLSSSLSFDHSAFKTWLSTFCIMQTNFYYVAPTAVPISISINVFCNSNANLANVETEVYNVILAFFVPRIGTINFDVYLSDLYQVAVGADPSIMYLQILNPTTDTIISSPSGTINPPQKYVTLANISGTTNPNVTVTASYATRS